MALTSGRATPQRADNKEYRFPVANAAVIYPGALVMLNASGEAQPGAVATGRTAAGRAETGTADDPSAVTVRRGVFRWKNSGSSDAITTADWGKIVYIVDDETVAKTDGSAARSAAGVCRGVDLAGVWVET